MDETNGISSTRIGYVSIKIRVINRRICRSIIRSTPLLRKKGCARRKRMDERGEERIS